MSSLVIAGDTSGSVTLQAPAVSGTTVLTLPATSGTVLTTASGTAATATNLAGGSNGTIPYQSASGTTQMLAVGTAGQLLQTNGAGAPTWATVSAGVGDHEVYVTTGNGYGSTNTKIERFSVTQRNVGAAITYADSATLGSSFTINQAGIYAMEYCGYTSSTDGSIGMSVNSTQLSTGINSITAANRICTTVTNASQTGQIFVATTALFAATDVVRPHVSNAGSNASVTTWFKIRKIGVAV